MQLICGIVRFESGPPPADVLGQMIAALIPAGRDAIVKSRIDDQAAFAMLELADDAEARPGELPTTLDGTWLAADLRLDRPGELAAALGLAPHSTAVALALAAVSRFGRDFPDRVDGDYAIAAWNPARRQLMCARDIMGTRPLCYTAERGRWCAFASTPRGLLASGLVAASPDRVALGSLLAGGYMREQQSEYEHIAWLPAGHSLEVTDSRTSLTRAWTPRVNAVGTWRGAPEDAASAMRALVEDAVAERLSTRGTAADLSGGLDSSAVCAIAARQLRARGQTLFAFSQLPLPRPGVDIIDERTFVDTVLAQEPNITWMPVHLPPRHLAPATDADGAYPLMVDPADVTCAAAAAAGADVLLTGSGGDEAAAFNGAGLHAALMRQGYWRALSRELGRWADRRGESRMGAFIDRVVRPLAADVKHAVVSRGEPEALALLAPRLRDQVRDIILADPALRNRREDRIWCLTNSYLASRATRWAVIGAQHGVAFTHPLSDRRVLDFALSLPLDHIVRDGWTRQPFRNAMAEILPDRIRWRESKFAPFPDAALRFADAKASLLATMAALRDSSAVQDFVDVDVLQAWLRSIPEGDAARALAEAANRDGPRTGAVRRAAVAVRALDFALFVDTQSR